MHYVLCYVYNYKNVYQLATGYKIEGCFNLGQVALVAVLQTVVSCWRYYKMQV